MNYYIELKSRDVAELIVKLIAGEFESDTEFDEEEKEKLTELILDKSNLAEGKERNYDITAVFYNKQTIGEMDQFILGEVRVNKYHLIKVYLQYRKLRDLREELKDFIDWESLKFFKNYDCKIIKYISLVNIMEKAIGLRNYKQCKVKCEKAQETVFNCSNCKIWV
jgi:hypothetical protein